jgi:hypothetical protein
MHLNVNPEHYRAARAASTPPAVGLLGCGAPVLASVDLAAAAAAMADEIRPLLEGSKPTAGPKKRKQVPYPHRLLPRR